MKVTSDREIRDRATLMLRRQVFLMLTSDIARQLKKSGGTEAEVLADFKKSRHARGR